MIALHTLIQPVHQAAQGDEQRQRDDKIAGGVEQVKGDAGHPAPHSVSDPADEHIYRGAQGAEQKSETAGQQRPDQRMGFLSQKPGRYGQNGPNVYPLQFAHLYCPVQAFRHPKTYQ